MDITPTAPRPRRYGIDWSPASDMARAHPGQPFKVTGIPAISTGDIKSGMRTFTPAGAFDAWRERGDLVIVYLGEPIGTWSEHDPHTDQTCPFSEIKRDPDYSQQLAESAPSPSPKKIKKQKRHA